MRNVVKFPPRLAGSDPLHEHVTTIRDVQLSLAASTKMQASSLTSLRESFLKIDALICCIDDAEVRGMLRLTLVSTFLEFLPAMQKALNAAAVYQKKASATQRDLLPGQLAALR